MKILGIDPGIGRVGWGMIEVQSGTLRRRSGQELRVENYGCIETEAGQSIEKRLLIVYDQVKGLIIEFKPEVLAIEELFFNTNAKTAFVVGQARGVILLAAAQNGLDVAIYTPLQVKIAITGYGRAEKSQVGQMVKATLKLESIPKPDDTADALAVAMTHAFSAKMRAKR